MEIKKRGILILGILLLVGTLFSLNNISAVGQISYCAERTVDGAWCQNVPIEKVDENYRYTATSCESTSYCNLGTCIDRKEGTCMENTPQRVCQESSGYWEDGEPDEIPQCQLGCCLIGDQAAFVTQTRCIQLTALYGLETDYRTDITSEIQCIASATSEVKGACVFEENFQTTCEFTTKRDCNELIASSEEGSVSFHEGYLCSAESLGTNCGLTEQTTCVEEKDEVYFLDSCGNLANIYDASRIEDREYWNKVYEKSESCNPSDDNADSATCGNCDYYLGSTCKAYDRGEDENRPRYGDNICRNLGCEYLGQSYEHGETWCADAKGMPNLDGRVANQKLVQPPLPGSRGFRLVCYNGDVTVEPCADFRQEVCIESEVNDFSVAACRVNRWQDCYEQDNKEDCDNIDRRDCRWSDNKVTKGCYPLIAPGFDFWNTDGNAEDICSRANEQCVVEYEKKLGGKEKCVKNCECLSSSWVDDKAGQCVGLGDCGVSINYLGFQGYETDYSIKKEEVDESEEQ